MRTDRVVFAIAATLLTMTSTSACSSEDEPKTKVVVGDSGGGAFSPEQQEVADAVDGYFTAFFGRGTKGIAAAVDGRVTDEVADLIVPAETKAVDDAGRQYLGPAKLNSETVKITDDTATFTGCLDASKVFIVKAGETAPQAGDGVVSSSDITFILVRQDGRWLISDPRSEKVDAC